MKQFIFLTALTLCCLVCGTAYCAIHEGDLYIINDKLYIKNPYEDASEHGNYCKLSDLKNATPEFRRCIDDGKYKGIVQIITSVNNWDFKIDNKTTCKRLTEKEYNADKVETVTGKVKLDKKSKSINIDVGIIEIDDLRNATEEFRNCIDNGKYKGTVEITAQIAGRSKQEDIFLHINRFATCKRK